MSEFSFPEKKYNPSDELQKETRTVFTTEFPNPIYDFTIIRIIAQDYNLLNPFFPKRLRERILRMTFSDNCRVYNNNRLKHQIHQILNIRPLPKMAQFFENDGLAVVTVYFTSIIIIMIFNYYALIILSV